MEKLQVPRQLHPLYAEPQSGRKSIPQGESFDEVPLSREGGKVVDLSTRSSQKELISDAEINRPARKNKPQAGKKRKEAAASTQPKSAQAFRQARAGNDLLSVEELKRLEAYADRINQLLTERASKRQQFENELKSARTGLQSSPVPDAAIKSTVAAINGGDQLPDGFLEQQDTETLKGKAEQVRQLLAEMTATLQADQSYHSQFRMETSQGYPSSVPPISPPISNPTSYSAQDASYRQGIQQPYYAPVTQPLPSGMPSHTRQQAEQDAEKAAAVLRHLNSREMIDPGRARSHPPRSHRLAPQPSWLHRWGLRFRHLFQVPSKPIDRVGDAMLWVVLAAVIRVGAKLLTAAHPVFGPLVLIIMIAPAAIALFLAFSAPKAGFISFYRLFLIMLGLVIGGKL